MGKSTGAELLRQRGVRVVDTDQIARDVVAPGEPAIDEIAEAFGKGIVSSTGALDRAELARLVFSDVSARSRLESILHPRIRQAWLRQVQLWREENTSVGAVVIPLLFETDAGEYFDDIICVACSAATQVARLLERGWTRDQIEQRRKAQWPVEKKMAGSDYVVWTEGTLRVHAAQWERICD